MIITGLHWIVIPNKLVPESTNTHTLHSHRCTRYTHMNKCIQQNMSMLYLLLGACWGLGLQTVLQDLLSGFPLPLPPQNRRVSCQMSHKNKHPCYQNTYTSNLSKYIKDCGTPKQDNYKRYWTKSCGKDERQSSSLIGNSRLIIRHLVLFI